jgi:hypothetical protein
LRSQPHPQDRRVLRIPGFLGPTRPPPRSDAGVRHVFLAGRGHRTQTTQLQADAWADREPAKVSRHLPWRVAHLPQALETIGWTAPGRWCQRFRPRPARGTHAHHVVVAMAQEMAAGIGAIAREVPSARATRLGGPRSPLDGRPPRCGAILADVMRRRGTRVPRARQAPDGRQSGGRQPTAIGVITRRADWRLRFHWSRDKAEENHEKRPAALWLTT